VYLLFSVIGHLLQFKSYRFLLLDASKVLLISNTKSTVFIAVEDFNSPVSIHVLIAAAVLLLNFNANLHDIFWKGLGCK
jgi:hypothetical protein